MSSDEECSVIGERAELGFIDYDEDRSVCSYNPAEEGDVHVSVPFPFVDGKPQSILVGSTASRPITINNTTSEQVSLWGVSIYDSNPENSFTVSLMEPPRSDSDVEAARDFLESFSLGERVLQPNKTLTVWLSCKPKDVCSHTTAVHFEFETGTIERVVILLADDKISKTLASKSRYSKGSRKQKQFPTETFHRGPAPSKGKPKVCIKRLPRYDIPPNIRDILERKEIPDIVLEGLTGIKNYVQFFKHLIIMEELKLEEDMRSYDLEHVSFKRRGNQYLALEVPGLAERRPSLVHGDFIYAKLASQCGDSSSPFQGYIHRVEADEVYLKFADEFHSSHRDGNLYNVQFTYNRVNMRRFYQAVDASLQLDKEVLFPSETHERRQITRKRLNPITRGLNEEQTMAIEMILGCKGAPPYVIHGPPGTGKTLTLVEAVLQTYKRHKNARILVCAPSNSAADHIMEKILKTGIKIIQTAEIFRLNATARPPEEIDPDLARYCYFEDGVFKCPLISVLLCFRIIVSTYVIASAIHGEGVKRGHFTHIFLDEAGQASEPETMIPVANFCGVNTVVILAGDPIQLGPVIYSKDAEWCGLGKSYLQRLFECECYSEKDEMYITKLVKNYRSHPAILHLPSEIFYQGELVACREEQSSFMDTVDFLPSKDFPLLFFGIQGCDEREGSNPSWFNRFEASKVVEIVRKLTEKGELGTADIGVITPYRQQVHKIKMALEHFDLTEVKVGSVEQFQGQEREVIIMSTVRSTIKHNDYDTKHCLGFLSNPRRFNVAITRAISLLIIIGNPHIICKDEYWNMLLWRCIDNNSYQGCPPPKKQELVENESAQEYESYANEEDDRSSRGVNWENNGLSNPTGWPIDSSPTEVPGPTGWPGESSTTELPIPVTNEAEWSDGWK